MPFPKISRIIGPVFDLDREGVPLFNALRFEPPTFGIRKLGYTILEISLYRYLEPFRGHSRVFDTLTDRSIDGQTIITASVTPHHAARPKGIGSVGLSTDRLLSESENGNICLGVHQFTLPFPVTLSLYCYAYTRLTLIYTNGNKTQPLTCHKQSKIELLVTSGAKVRVKHTAVKQNAQNGNVATSELHHAPVERY